MTKGKAKIEIKDLIARLEFKDITFCEFENLVCKVLDKIYIDLCEDSCTGEQLNCQPTC